MNGIGKILRANVGANSLHDVFTDFVEMYAIAFRNRVDRVGFDDRETRFERIKARYRDDDMQRFTEAFVEVVGEMERDPRDVLGELYMHLEIADKQNGQFFTPFDVARLMAELSVGGLVRELEHRPFVTLGEPACGAGAFIIATCLALQNRDVDWQNRLHVSAEDISTVAVHMCYLHLSLLHVPAVISRCDTLTRETWDVWRTPAHVLGDWDRRLRTADAIDSLRELEPAAPVKPAWSGGLLDGLEAA